MSTPQTKIYDEFLYNAAGRMMKPLNKILSSGEALMQSVEGASDDTQKQLCYEILDHGHHALDLVNDIRDYSEIQTGRILIEKKPTDLNLLVKGVLEMVPWFTQEKPQLTIQQDIPPSLPSLSISAVRIQQVLINLIYNAVKFTDSGVIKISVELSPAQITFQVKDTGVGIPKDRFALVFAPFQTAFSDPTDSRVGLGLGLPICKYVVEAHHGKLWFESTQGQGSTFYFSLPVEQ